MTTAAAAAEYRANVGPDFTFADAYDADQIPERDMRVGGGIFTKSL